LKEIFAIISQLSGISFIFDNDVKDQNVSITLEKASFHQSLGMLAGMYKLGHKKLNETSILIYPQNPEKVKQYQNMQLRTFYLSYLDVKKAANLVKSMVPVRRLYISEDSNSLVVRDTRDVNDVIEKILEVHDLPDPEVVLDVEVLEINDKSGHDVGLLLSNYSVTLGPFTPGGKLLSPSLSSGTGTTPVDISQLLKAFSIKGFGGYVTVPNATYNFGKTLAQGKILANPKIRVKNKEKSKFTVGQRVPIQTTSSTGTITSSNVQYVDVGIKLNAEPNIQLSNEVVVKLGLEVSSVINKETSKADGTTLLTIGTRNLDTVLSLKDGETVIIGGLIQNTDTDSQTKTFLLGDLPLLGQLLSNSSTSKEKNELLLSITPRLVRGVLVPSRKLTSFTSGKDEDPALLSDYEAFIQEPEYVVSMPVAQPVPPSVQPPIQKQINEPLNPLQSTPPITKQP
jgi:general secretion pathway protein D